MVSKRNGFLPAKGRTLTLETDEFTALCDLLLEEEARVTMGILRLFGNLSLDALFYYKLANGVLLTVIPCARNEIR